MFYKKKLCTVTNNVRILIGKTTQVVYVSRCCEKLCRLFVIEVACFYGFYRNLEPVKYSSVLSPINSFDVCGRRAIVAISLQMICLQSFLFSSTNVFPRRSQTGLKPLD